MNKSDSSKKRLPFGKCFYRRRSSQNRNQESSSLSTKIVSNSHTEFFQQVPSRRPDQERPSIASDSYQDSNQLSDKKVETNRSSIPKLFSRRSSSKNQIDAQSTSRPIERNVEHPNVVGLKIQEEEIEGNDKFDVASNSIPLRKPVSTKKGFNDHRRSSLFDLASKGLVSARRKYEITKAAKFQANNDDRTVSGNVLDLARDFQRRLVHQERQKRTMSKVEEIKDIDALNQMVS